MSRVAFSYPKQLPQLDHINRSFLLGGKILYAPCIWSTKSDLLKCTSPMDVNILYTHVTIFWVENSYYVGISNCWIKQITDQAKIIVNFTSPICEHLIKTLVTLNHEILVGE